ncbi:MAG TPA: protein DpdE [Acidimicrobiales bacterium]|nr:protein DpdE [Acidimicrobiales bacterium]
MNIVGQFVRVGTNRLGIGKIVAANADSVEVEYFDSVGPRGRHRVTAKASQVERVQVSLQRRCYWPDGAGWRVGRVVWQGEGEYGVRPPDSEIDLRVPEEDLFVRWSMPIEDPIEVLIAGGNESPYFHDCRAPFVQTVVAQRAASHGMHGVLSSVVELHDHQLEVVRRVLEDPRQRYLLADEVGLGKTIEAGLIIRQYLLDHPEGHVVVLAPPMLRRQWAAELREKFTIDDFDRAVIAVLAHDNPDSWAGGARDTYGRYSPHRNAGLLVVDEVHNLSAGPTESQEYSALKTLAVAVPRLLLLSATPLLHNEDTFLRMLHLLDPDVYRLEDIEGFQRRVQDRQALGTAFFTFRHDIPPFLLREKVNTLRAMFESDAQLADLLQSVEDALQDPVSLAEAVTAARIHISDTYRVHRRLLRTRRSDSLAASFPVRGRQRPKPLGDAKDLETAADDWIEDWREYLRSTLADDDEVARRSARAALVAFLERSTHLPLLRACASFRLTPDAASAEAAELTSGEQDALRAVPVDATEQGILERAATLETDVAAGEALVRSLRGERRRTVVFTTFTAHARSIADLLAAEFGAAAVATHLRGDDPARVEEGMDNFKDPAQSCWVLVCDRSAEEGRNLQFADQAVHADLPLSPNRIEQRIGRLDRYGRGDRIPTLLLDYPATSIMGAWTGALAEGFGVFDSSIASLQFAVDALMPRLLDALLDDGPSGLVAFTEELPRQLEREREAIAEQDALDAIETSGQIGELALALDDLEDVWFQMQRATEALLCDHPGNLRFQRVVDREDERFRSYRLIAPGKAAHLNSMPLVAWDVLRSNFRGIVDRPGSYFRRAAVARPDARLFRVGEPFIDALAEYIRWDDRGQTFAFWRAAREVVDDEVFFRFDYLVDAATDEAEVLASAAGERLDRRAVQRRADGFLAPRLETIWTTLDGSEVDSHLLVVLERPYDPATGDVNLNVDRRWALDELVGSADWESRCRSARHLSEVALRHRPDFEAAADLAATKFESALRSSSMKRRTRLAFVDPRQRAREEEELRADDTIDSAVVAGLRTPRVRLDAVGAVVLSPRTPTGQGFPRPKR